MEKLIKQKYPSIRTGKGKIYCPKVHLVRYADDFVVTADKRETLDEIKTVLTEFLDQRGLSFSEEKTLITNISEGFDFLGFNIRKYNGKLLIKPSQKSQKKVIEKLHEAISKHKSASQCLLIEMLNPIIMGWGNYFRHVVSKEVFSKIDHILVQSLIKWAYRRHRKKSKKWAVAKYFKSEKNRKWVFKDTFEFEGQKQVFILKRLADIPIVRHVKIRKDANPFDFNWYEYFDKRSHKPNNIKKAGQAAGIS